MGRSRGVGTGILPADKARIDALGAVVRMFVTSPDAKGTSNVHAAFQGDDFSNDFPGAFTNPDVTRNLRVTFDVGWDGGDVLVFGTDQWGDEVNENFAADPGATVVGTSMFQTVTSATKSAIGGDPAAASIGTGDRIGVDPPYNLPADGLLFVDDVIEAFTMDQGFTAFVPTTVPNGTHVYKLLINI